MYSKLSIASLILGLLSLSSLFIFSGNKWIFLLAFYLMILLPVLPILGMVFGGVAIGYIKEKKLRGMGFAILGIIFSIIGLIGFFAFIVERLSELGSFIS